MNTAAINHRPDSEFAYLYQKDLMHIRLKTAKNDVKKVELLHGDTYTLEAEKWYQKPLVMEKYLTTELHDYWVVATSEPYKRMAYGFKVVGLDDSEIFYGDHGCFPAEKEYLKMPNNYFRMPYFHEVDRFKAPAWVKNTVWYQIFPERFANGDKSNDPKGTLPWGSKDPDRQDFFGGDLQGVLDHLDHFTELGINGLYFCPIFKAHSNHKYDTIDYFEIDPDFGDKKLFKKLVAECHKRGIKIMLDAVFNHMGDTSPQWQDVLQNGAASKYADWFHINEFPASYKEGKDFEDAYDITYDVFAFTPHMPKLNTANPEVKKYLLEIAAYWIKEFDIDAWRLDVANEVDHTFWREFRQVCDAAKDDFYILGEIWHSSQSWLNGDEFTAVMNYAYTDAISSAFVKKDITLEKMVSEINRQLMLYRQQTNQVQFNVLDSHDTPRILTEAKNDKDLMKQVEAFTYLQPGVPCIYYGDEFAMTGEMDPDCRKCMVWQEEDQDLDMFAFFKKLVKFRRDFAKILSEGQMIWENVDLAKQQIVLQRKLADKKIIGYFNLGENANSLTIKGEIILANGFTADLKLAPKGFVITKED
ncbi:glycoside hydrolase family 13 protein [Enterococcus montenegrensis]|uniref:glycoside hydrolase family 13 protein n=1 Tax=Enterococcus montenegrensis TaxID=3031993 RepID=UPI00249DA62F|nr:glycoside hydrolase family 13 protein [Enterococcus montenegrensis]WHA09803.1 glycoside hydrolase family 13 protein [Enterococcus montenegrensis]